MPFSRCRAYGPPSLLQKRQPWRLMSAWDWRQAARTDTRCVQLNTGYPESARSHNVSFALVYLPTQNRIRGRQIWAKEMRSRWNAIYAKSEKWEPQIQTERDCDYSVSYRRLNRQHPKAWNIKSYTFRGMTPFRLSKINRLLFASGLFLV
jgi:hypothetical protein